MCFLDVQSSDCTSFFVVILMFRSIKEMNYKWVMKNVSNINDISDLVGRNKDGELIESSLLFLLLCRTFKNQMKLTADIVSDRSISLRQKIIMDKINFRKLENYDN